MKQGRVRSSYGCHKNKPNIDMNAATNFTKATTFCDAKANSPPLSDNLVGEVLLKRIDGGF